MKKLFLKTLCTSAVALAPMAGSAACIDAYMTGLNEFEQGQTVSKPSFRVNELLVLCFTPNQSGFVSVYDAPIEGDFQQLYPNILTHPDGETYTEVEAGTQYCFGGRDSFPLYHPPEEGIGIGKISITLTSREDYQLDDDDYAIPGQKVTKSTMNLHLSNHQKSQAKCSARDVTYLDYRITN
ncbi:DUF4384 domain-containing protein [Pseudohalocynthiibacter aestuariivivens]|uniref:DUF4384 domain-containing protein n=1 Tax=Roseovarius pelagicus TaxID=2980108 RepID=A0ABY6D8I3_9RHOB|nr:MULTISPECIES: DUF4384 domain-containing protein [Rhodobacterales]QIE45643.1 DUF4384 domain-containing protein [Pseudohalocynthiibacter aestuariivivens]UXX82439.1 DUF4384 domain-containing protein [Roseovarius pelagicus]